MASNRGVLERSCRHRRGGPVRRGRMLLAAGLLLCAGAARAEDTFRCGQHLVSIRSTEDEVLGACGEPVYRDRWVAALPAGSSITDVWYYDHGPDQLLRVLKFRNGALDNVATDGYGFGGQAVSCSPGQIAEGISKYRLLRLCGTPGQARAASILRPVQPIIHAHTLNGSSGSFQDAFQVPVYREHWVYEFGSGRLPRYVTLENGWVRTVDTDPTPDGEP